MICQFAHEDFRLFIPTVEVQKKMKMRVKNEIGKFKMKMTMKMDMKMSLKQKKMMLKRIKTMVMSDWIIL